MNMEFNQEKLYDAFGELLYVVAMADGLIQDEEITALERVLADHPWAADIKWSFEYERKKGNAVEDVYDKVIDYCKYNGPHPEYQKMVEVMEAVANASAGVDAEEQAVMDGFVKTLVDKFKTDIENIK